MSMRKDAYEAASRIGRDGKGKDGAVGYFMWLAVAHPAVYGRLLLEFSRQPDPEANLVPEANRYREMIITKLCRPSYEPPGK